MPQKKKIAFITPWPPQMSGISEYTYDLVCSINKFEDFAITVVTSCKKPVTISGVTIISCQDENKLPNLQGYDLIIHEIGNNPLHILNYWVLQKYGGVVQLHDLVLNDLVRHIAISSGKAGFLYKTLRRMPVPHTLLRLLRGIYGPAFFYKSLRCLRVPSRFHEILLRWYGAEAVEIDKKREKETRDINFVNNVSDYPLFEELLQYAQSVIVHSIFAKNIIQQVFSELQVTQFPMLHLLKNIQDKTKLIDLTIGTFGFSDKLKHTDLVIKAIAQLLGYSARNGKPHTTLIIVGPSDFKVEKKLVRALQIAQYVKFVSYPSLAEFNALMQQVDLVVQLRYPTRGETSGPVTKALQLGVPIVVSDNGWYHELPEFVEKTQCPPNIMDIYSVLKKILYPEPQQISYCERLVLANSYAKALDYKSNINDYRDLISRMINQTSHEKNSASLGSDIIQEIKI